MIHAFRTKNTDKNQRYGFNPKPGLDGFFLTGNHTCKHHNVLNLFFETFIFQPVIIGFSGSKLKKGRRHVVYYLFVRRTSLRACLYHVGGVLKTNPTVVPR